MKATAGYKILKKAYDVSEGESDSDNNFKLLLSIDM